MSKLWNFNLPFFHGKSTTIDWIPNDSKKEFEKHISMYPDSEHLNNYKNNPIKYKLNNYGFRTDDDFFDGDIGTVYLGCSHTFGLGHYLENTWSYKLHQKVGEGKFFNLSCGGVGLTTQYYFLKYFSDMLNIKKVYHYYPPEVRYRYGFMNGDGKIDVFAKYFDEETSSVDTELWKKYLVHETHNEFHNKLHLDAITCLCSLIECDYIRVENSYMNDKFCDAYHKELTPSRDLLNPYVERHDKIVDNFLKLNRNNSVI